MFLLARPRCLRQSRSIPKGLLVEAKGFWPRLESRLPKLSLVKNVNFSREWKLHLKELADLQAHIPPAHLGPLLAVLAQFRPIGFEDFFAYWRTQISAGRLKDLSPSAILQICAACYQGEQGLPEVLAAFEPHLIRHSADLSPQDWGHLLFWSQTVGLTLGAHTLSLAQTAESQLEIHASPEEFINLLVALPKGPPERIPLIRSTLDGLLGEGIPARLRWPLVHAITPLLANTSTLGRATTQALDLLSHRTKPLILVDSLVELRRRWLLVHPISGDYPGIELVKLGVNRTDHLDKAALTQMRQILHQLREAFPSNMFLSQCEQLKVFSRPSRSQTNWRVKRGVWHK